LRADWRIAARYPPQPDTQGLLALPDLQSQALAGREMVIFRGVGGRDALGRELRARGARVTFCEVYRQVPEQRWRDSVRAELARPGSLLAVAHSGSLVRELRAVLDAMPVATPVPPCLVPGARVAAAARRLGLQPLVAASALAAEMEREIRRWYTPAT
jgi:uroporphyrinogen-III synthase